eukprot:1432560-Prorocentrum_lima.AAC.1
MEIRPHAHSCIQDKTISHTEGKVRQALKDSNAAANMVNCVKLACSVTPTSFSWWQCRVWRLPTRLP